MVVASNSEREKISRVNEVLGKSDQSCKVRVRLDLENTIHMEQTQWKGRVELLELIPKNDVVDLLFRLDVCALVLQDEQPILHEGFALLMQIPKRYPLLKPRVQLVGPTIPWNPHVLHGAVAEERLPVELRPYAHLGRGTCCYINNWSADIRNHNLPLVIAQISRVLTLTRFHGEAGTLNPEARDDAIRRKERGELPLGPALPFPLLDQLDAKSHPIEPAGELVII